MKTFFRKLAEKKFYSRNIQSIFDENCRLKQDFEDQMMSELFNEIWLRPV